MKVTLADGSQMECEDQAFAEGGEGLLFWDKAGTHVIKLYKGVEPQREAALQEIIGERYSVVKGEPYWKKLFTWPEAIIKQPGLGLIMPRAPEGSVDLTWLLMSKSRRAFAAKYGADKLGKWANYLSIAIKMARVVGRMHFRGLCHSDLSFRNFLVNPSENKAVLIDCDGLVVPGFLPPGVLGTPGCMAPELMAQLTSPGSKRVVPSLQTDLHALATLIYWLLLQRHPLAGPKRHDSDPARDEALGMGERALFIEHPTDKSNHIPNLPATLSYSTMLTPAVRDLVKQAFVDGLHNPNKRPQAIRWAQALIRMTDSIVPCENKKCPLGSFIIQPHQKGIAQCPCGQRLKNPAFLPILNFYRPQRGRKGNFQNDQGYVLVGWHSRPLHVWHASPGDFGPDADQNPKATFEFDHRRSKWYLQNIDLAEARLLDGVKGKQDIHPGKKVELVDGMRLLLGPPDQCRLAYIQMLKLA